MDGQQVNGNVMSLFNQVKTVAVKARGGKQKSLKMRMLGGDIPIGVHVNTFLFRERSLTSVEPTQLALHNLTRTHTRSLCRRAKLMYKT